ncbi:MAG: response regulator [Nitrospinota bacterium]
MKIARVMVCEFEKRIADDIKKNLEGMNYQVTGIFTSCEDAYKAAGDLPDLVLMNIALPGEMTGVEAAEKIHFAYQVPIIFLTSSAEDFIRHKGDKATTSGYLVKPFSKRKLQTFVERALDKNRGDRGLREKSLKLKTLLDAISIPICLINVKTLVVELANKASGNLGGEVPCFTFLYNKKIRCSGRNPCPVEIIKESGGPVTMDREYENSAGEVRHVELRAYPMFDEKGVLTHIVEQVLDVTEWKKREQGLLQAKEGAERANSLKDKFVSLVAHDLRAPFGSIVGLLKLLQQDFKHPLHPDHQKVIEVVLQSAGGMTQLIDDLLIISRMQTGILKINKTFFNLHALISSVVKKYEKKSEDKGVRVSNEIPEETRVFGDIRLIVAVFENLLNNAVKFSKSGETITFFLQKGDSITIAVQDSGRGIAEKDCMRLFKYEEKTTTLGTAGEPGTGLGLPMVMDILKAHDGHVSVESQLEEGSTFLVSLPKVRPVVMVVEDEENVRLLIAALLEPLDVKIIEAKDGVEAKQVLDDKTVHLIITDLKMPNMGGSEFLKSIRKTEKTSKVPVIVVTFYSDSGTRDRMFACGANDFVDKSLNEEDFLPRVKRFLGAGGK